MTSKKYKNKNERVNEHEATEIDTEDEIEKAGGTQALDDVWAEEAWMGGTQALNSVWKTGLSCGGCSAVTDQSPGGGGAASVQVAEATPGQVAEDAARSSTSVPAQAHNDSLQTSQSQSQSQSSLDVVWGLRRDVLDSVWQQR